MKTSITIFTPYPFTIGEKIHISHGPRHGDWMVAGVDDKKVTLRCPISGKEFNWERFCYLAENRVQDWPQAEKTEPNPQERKNTP